MLSTYTTDHAATHRLERPHLKVVRLDDGLIELTRVLERALRLALALLLLLGCALVALLLRALLLEPLAAALLALLLLLVATCSKFCIV